MKAKVPSDPLVHLLWALNRIHRPEWEAKVLQWFRKNNIRLVVEGARH